MKKRFLALSVSAVLAVSMLAGCGGGSSAGGSSAAGSGAAGGSNVIKVGVFEPQTGENGGGGLQEVDGIRYANKQKGSVKIGDKEYKIELGFKIRHGLDKDCPTALPAADLEELS